MRDRLADPLFDGVCAALLVSDRVGGRNVSAVLDRLAETTRRQLLVHEELRAQQARHVLSARIVAAVPLVVLVLVRQVNPRYLALFDTPGGQLLLALGPRSARPRRPGRGRRARAHAGGRPPGRRADPVPGGEGRDRPARGRALPGDGLAGRGALRPLAGLALGRRRRRRLPGAGLAA